MGCQSPPLSNRTAPMPVPGLLPIADLKPHPPDDASQSHDALSPMANCSVAEGEKLRLGGQLPAGAFAPSVGASTPAPQPKLPVQSPTMSVRYYFPKSSVSFLRPDDFDWMRNQWSVSLDEEPITTLLLWGQCQDAHGGLCQEGAAGLAQPLEICRGLRLDVAANQRLGAAGTKRDPFVVREQVFE